MSFPEHHWVFPARTAAVVDGDTVDLVIDQGMHSTRQERVRLLSVDAPEVRGPSRLAGIAAKKFVSEWMINGNAFNEYEWNLLVRTEKDPDNFSRYLAQVWRRFDGACLNEDLLSTGHAVPYEC